MNAYVAFIRGINVGGNSKLPMKDLSGICEGLGFADVRTYINSGNVLFTSALSEEKIRAKLEKALHEKMGKHVDVAVRTSAELRSILQKNPFPDAVPSQVGVLLLSETVPKNIMKGIATDGPEEVKVSGRELYIHFPNGMGRSKLKLPDALKGGTVRNINTISKLAGLAE